MIDRCRESDIEFIVILIPTKETVFETRLAGRSDLANPEQIARLLEAEQSAREDLTRFLQGQGVDVIDPLPLLRKAAGDTVIYPPNEDGHPISAGYRAIAESVLQELEPARNAARL